MRRVVITRLNSEFTRKTKQNMKISTLKRHIEVTRVLRQAFPWWLMILSIFPCTCMSSLCHLYVFFRKNVYSDLEPIFNQIVCLFLLLSCMSSLRILDINPLSELWFTIFYNQHISFSFSQWFSLLYRSFLVWYSLTCLFLLLLLSIWCQVKKSSPKPMTKSLPPVYF